MIPNVRKFTEFNNVFGDIYLLFLFLQEKLVQVLEKMKWETSMRLQDPSRSIRGEKLTTKLDKLIKRYLSKYTTQQVCCSS